MIIVIRATVPDSWRDVTDDSGILSGPYEDVMEAAIGAGLEDVDIRAED